MSWRAAPGLGVFVAVTGLAASNGGYFPTEWGWAALGFLLAVLGAVLVRERVELGGRELLLVGAFGLLVSWTALSALWSSNAEAPLLEAERSSVYAAAAGATILLASRRAARVLPLGVLAATVAVAAYALATRLVPDHVGTFDSSGGYQLAAPIGYWNALGILLAIGLVLALGTAAGTAAPRERAAAGLAIGVLAPALEFTFSRGATLALGAGLLVLVALEPRRLRLTALLVALAPLPLLAAWLCARTDALTREGARLADAAHVGHRLAPILLVLALAEGGVALAVARSESRVRIGPRAERVWATTLAVVALLAAAGALARAGGPGRLVGRANDAFRAPIAKPSGDLNGRLLSFSGNGRSDYWRVAWHEARAHPLLGGGAGSYERHWFRERPNAFVTRDAHNLYLETLAELGPPGLALLLVALALPLTTLRRARHVPLATASAAAYAVFLVHAALDWDWEVPAATLPALVCGWSLFFWTRPEGASRPLTTRVRAPVAAGALAVAAGILVLHVGNVALAKSSAAAGSGDARRADSEARRARAWAPWSAQPWQALAVAQLAEGRRDAARSSLREAIERDGSNWELWYGLAVASSGPERRLALDRVTRLNPRSPEADQLRTTR